LGSKKTEGRTANSVLAVTTLSHMMQHIYVGTSVLFPLIMAELNMNYTEFGVAIAVSSLIGGLFQVFFSMISRRIARHILLGLGNILLSFGTFLTSIAYSFIHFISGRIISNIGVAPQHSMGTAIISEKFDHKSIGKAIGIHYGIAYIGNIIGPLFMTFLVVTIGWRNALLAFSVPAVIVGLTVIWYLNKDAKLTQPSEARDTVSLRADLVTLVRTKSVIPIIVTQVVLSGGTDLGIITTYIPLFLADALKLDAHSYIYGLTYTIGLIGGVVGPVLLGKCADKIGHLKSAALASFLASILMYLLTFYGEATLILAFHLFFLILTSFALPTLLQSHLLKITQKYRRDLVVGIFFTVNLGFSSLWAGVMGYIIDAYSSFTPAFILMGTLGLAASVIIVDQLRKIETS